MVSQGFIYALFATTRGFLGPPLAQTLKLTSGLKFRRNRLIGAIVIALVLGFFVSIGDTVYTAYRHGGYNLGGLTRVAGVRNNYQRAVTLDPQSPTAGLGQAHVCRVWDVDCVVTDLFAIPFYLVAFARCWSGAAGYVYGTPSGVSGFYGVGL